MAKPPYKGRDGPVPPEERDSGPGSVGPPTEPGAPAKRSRRLRTSPPVGPAPSYEPIEIDNHRGLIGKQREIFRRLNDNPEIASLLFLNPVLALKEIDVELSPEMRRHVLDSVRQPPGLRARREELEASLEERLGERPRPLDREWLAETLFTKLSITPLKTRGHRPAYRPPFNAESIARMQKLRPDLRKATHVPRSGRGNMIRVKKWRPAFRRMDLDATVPELSPASSAPKTVSLETLFFYKDAHPVARDLLELGTLMRRAFPIQSPESYRRIRSGEKANAFRAWITSVRFEVEGSEDAS